MITTLFDTKYVLPGKYFVVTLQKIVKYFMKIQKLIVHIM